MALSLNIRGPCLPWIGLADMGHPRDTQKWLRLQQAVRSGQPPQSAVPKLLGSNFLTNR